MHGLDEYDSEARWYYPAIMRTTTMDPLCEKYYSTSPYAWCGNNPVNLVDPDGRGTFWANGVEIGNDGKDDDKIYWLTTRVSSFPTKEGNVNGVGLSFDEEMQTKAFIMANSGSSEKFKEGCLAYKNSVDILISSSDLRAQMLDAINDDGSGGDSDNNNREYFGSVETYRGLIHNVAAGEVGNRNAPSSNSYSGWVDFHSHWSGKTRFFEMAPCPSLNDLTAVGDKFGFVFGMSNKTVYFYNKNGVLATCPIENFVTPKR